MEAEITSRTVDFIKRNARAGKPSTPTFRSRWCIFRAAGPEFAGKTGNGDWADCLAEMDYRTGQILDAIKEAGIEDNTIVIFTSDNGPEAIHPWEGDSGPWRGTYFTAMEASLRAPFIIRWPGKVPAGRVSNEIVHIVDIFTTFARVAGAEVPKDRPIDGVDQLDFFLGKQENSNREGFPPTWPTAVGGQMAELENAPDLAGEMYDVAAETALAEGLQLAHRPEGGARRGRRTIPGSPSQC